MGFKLTISSIGSGNGLVPTRRQTIIWTDDGPVWYSAYASLDFNDLMSCYISHFHQMIRADKTGCCFRINKRQNDHHFADDIVKFTSLYDFILWLLFWLKLFWNLFPKIQTFNLKIFLTYSKKLSKEYDRVLCFYYTVLSGNQKHKLTDLQ